MPSALTKNILLLALDLAANSSRCSGMITNLLQDRVAINIR